MKFSPMQAKINGLKIAGGLSTHKELRQRLKKEE